MKQAKGFTIMELLIVVVIIGILSAVGLGFYGDNVAAANRTDARSALSETAGSLEKCKSLYGAYNAGNCTVTFPVASDSGYYSVTAALAVSTFTLTATPVAGQPQANDGDCTTLTLTNTGVRGATGADTTECW